MAEKEEKIVEEKVETKKKTKKEKSLLSKIINVILWIILLLWMAACMIDFYGVYKEKDPMFCISKGQTKYEDGTVDWCIGAGYKIYHYNRKSYNAVEFGPFWIEDRSKEETK